VNPDAETKAEGPRRGQFWPRARAAFRWLRIAGLGVVLFGAGVLLWCNYAGVPRAISGLFTAELRRKNLHVEFSRLKLSGFRRIIARDLRFTSSASNNFPRFDARAAELLLNFGQLKKGRIELSGLRLEGGRVLIPIQAANDPARFLAISNLTAEVEFLPGDTLRISNVAAESLGARARASGQLRNFSKYARPPAAAGDPMAWERWKEEMRETIEVFEKLHFAEPPEVSLRVAGDTADPASLRGSVSISARAAESEWGAFDRLEMASGVFTSRTNAAVKGTFRLELDGFRSPWVAAAVMRLNAEMIWTGDMDRLLSNVAAASASEVESRWGNAAKASADLSSENHPDGSTLRTRLTARASTVAADDYAVGASEFDATLNHALPFPTPAAWFRRFLHGAAPEPARRAISGDWRWQSSGIKLARSSFDSIGISGGIRTTNVQPAPDGSVGFWRHLAGAEIPWSMTVSNVLSEEIDIGSLRVDGDWAWPRFQIGHMNARLYDGEISGKASLDVATRKGSASAEGNFEYKKIARLLDRPVQRWLEQFAWETPPFIQAEARFELPGWTNSWDSREILATLTLAGKLDGAASYRAIPIEKAEGHFYFSNFVWRLPDLRLTRPEGQTLLDYTGNVTNGDFAARIDWGFDPGALRALVAEKDRKGFDLARFPEAPRLAGELAGNWDRQEEITFKGRVAATNFYARGTEVLGVECELAYSNLVLECWNVTAHMGTGVVRAPYLRLDFPSERMFVTNAVSTINPYDAMFIVGPESYEAIDPYRFAIPPTVKVNGFVPLRHVSKADLWFEVAGDEFTFWKFNLPRVAGTVHWRADELWITNVDASFYTGRAAWEGYFLINDKEHNADFRFHGSATNADLKLLVADLFGLTNQMEGRFTGELVITSARSDDMKSWDGHGTASLSDGFLWSVPVFGVLTPVLDAIVPGAAMSRVTSGNGNFSITNSVVHTRDMQVRTKAFRLNYKGSVDLDGALDALVDAEIFRDAWLVGKFFSVALWPVSKAFEARISGSVNEPKTQLRYFPRFLFAPFKSRNPASETNKAEPPPEPAGRE
jgi:hypothetical protein